MFNIKYQSKLIIISLLLLAAIFLSGVAIYQEYEKQAEITELDEGLKLKAPEENIVQYTEYDENGRPLQSPSAENNAASSNNIIQYIYRTDKVVPQETYRGLKEDITQRTPNAQIFLKSAKQVSADKIEKTYVGRFYSGVNFNKSGDKWYQTEVATTTKTAFLKQTKPTLFVKAKRLFSQPVFADTYYSGAGDGQVNEVNDSGTPASGWNATHDNTNGWGDGGIYLISPITVRSEYTHAGTVDEFAIDRAFLPFNTAAIPSSAIILSASVSIYVISKLDEDNDGQDYVNVTHTFQASSASLTLADYFDNGSDNDTAGRATTTPIQTGATAIDIGNITTSAYNAFTLNTTGLDWIAKSGSVSACGITAGFTCLGLREGHDLEDVAISSVVANSITVASSEATDTNTDPYLTVTYSALVPAININSGNVNINSGNVNINSNSAL